MFENSFEVNLTKVEQFVRLLKEDGGDLFESVEKLYSYCFGKSSLEQLLKALLADQTNLQKAKNVLTKLRDFVLSKLDECVLVNFDEADSKQMSDAFGIFMIAIALKTFGVDNLWTEQDVEANDKLSKCTDAFIEKLKALRDCNPIKEKANQKGIFGSTTKIALPSSAVKKTFEEKVEKLLSEMSRKVFSFTLMDEIADSSSGFEAHTISFSTFCSAADCLAMACAEVDIRVRERYLNTMKRFFFIVDDFNAAMRYVYGLQQFCDSPGNVPDLRNYYKNFDFDMTKILNSITELNTFSVNPNSMQITRTMAFLLMIAPKPAIRQLLIFMLSSKPLWPSAFYIMEKIPAFFELRVRSASTTTQKKELLIIIFFRRLLNVERGAICMDREADREMLESLILHFCRTQFKVVGGVKEVYKRPLFKATELLRDFVLDYLSSSVHVGFLLQLLNRMLRVSDERYWQIDWSSCDDDESMPETANNVGVVPWLVTSLLIDNYINSEDFAIRALVIVVFKSLAGKFKADGVNLSSKSELILEKLKTFNWCLRFCVCRWLQESIDTNVVKIEIPNVLYKALAPKCRAIYAPIASAIECNETEDFLRSLFELALTSIKDAEEFIRQNEFALLPTKVYSPMLADALLRSLRADTRHETLVAMRPLIDSLFALLDPPIETHCCNLLTEQMFSGMRKLAPILVIFDALHIYIIENADDSDSLDSTLIGHDARILFETFCLSVSTYVGSEFSKLKTDTISFKSSDFSSHTESELLSAINQLSIIFTRISFLAEKLQPIPAQLKRLKVELSNLHRQLNNKIFPPYAEDINRYSRPLGNVAGASAPAPTTAVSPTDNAGAANRAEKIDSGGKEVEENTTGGGTITDAEKLLSTKDNMTRENASDNSRKKKGGNFKRGGAPRNMEKNEETGEMPISDFVDSDTADPDGRSICKKNNARKSKRAGNRNTKDGCNQRREGGGRSPTPIQLAENTMHTVSHTDSGHYPSEQTHHNGANELRNNRGERGNRRSGGVGFNRRRCATNRNDLFVASLDGAFVSFNRSSRHRNLMSKNGGPSHSNYNAEHGGTSQV